MTAIRVPDQRPPVRLPAALVYPDGRGGEARLPVGIHHLYWPDHVDFLVVFARLHGDVGTFIYPTDLPTAILRLPRREYTREERQATWTAALAGWNVEVGP